MGILQYQTRLRKRKAKGMLGYLLQGPCASEYENIRLASLPLDDIDAYTFYTQIFDEQYHIYGTIINQNSIE